MLQKQFDFLIIGSGLAGLYSAFTAAKYGTVALVTKTELDVSNSYHAQGGIAAVTDANDFPKDHMNDTMTAGRGLCDYTPVEILVNEGPDRIKELIEMGMEFDRINGELALALEGGHMKRRVLHAGGDATGKKMVQFLIKQVKSKSNIQVFEQHMVYELLVQNKQCFGAKSYNKERDENLCLLANATILALGGTSAIYQRTTNPETTVGDGIALAYQAGAQIMDMEFIQFHPSSFYTEKGYTFLISEAVRGEGAQLLNARGERFMSSIHPLAELAPRDIVARSIFNEIQMQKEDFVRLSLKHLDAEKMVSRFPSIHQKCQKAGVDMSQEIPVAPAAHYMVGGIKTGRHGETNIQNLYACGELAASGVMGANRLASNSLLECLVFGKRAIEHANQNGKLSKVPDNSQAICCKEDLSYLFLEKSNQIAKLMNSHVGIIREEKQLIEVLEQLHQFKNSFPFEENEFFSLRLQNLIQVCELLTKAAIARKESRGGHYRKDFDQEKENFLAHSVQQINKEITFVPVEQKTQD
jgi:L-aspartate oxidase